MKKIFTAFAALSLLVPLIASAASLTKPIVQPPIATCVSGKPQVAISWNRASGASYYSVYKNNKATTSWQTLSSRQTATVVVDKTAVAGLIYQYQVKASSRSKVAYSSIVSVQIPNCATSTTATTTTPTSPSSNETTFTAYLTGYGWPDNTPAGGNVSNGVIHSSAGGIGTFADPITIAVGHSILNGKDILDYAAGTKFYIPALRKYFIVEDTCGDGATPQNGPCHTGHNGLPWLDAWVGGEGANTSSIYACEDKITGDHTIIQNPASNYTVNPGPVFSGTCSTLYSETAIKI